MRARTPILGSTGGTAPAGRGAPGSAAPFPFCAQNAGGEQASAAPSCRGGRWALIVRRGVAWPRGGSWLPRRGPVTGRRSPAVAVPGAPLPHGSARRAHAVAARRRFCPAILPRRGRKEVRGIFGGVILGGVTRLSAFWGPPEATEQPPKPSPTTPGRFWLPQNRPPPNQIPSAPPKGGSGDPKKAPPVGWGRTDGRVLIRLRSALAPAAERPLQAAPSGAQLVNPR